MWPASTPAVIPVTVFRSWPETWACSGLAQDAWARAGTSITRTTDTQWHDGPHIPRDKLQPGDLIFFATNPSDPATIHHVALNIDGQRMTSPSTTGSRQRRYQQIAPSHQSIQRGRDSRAFMGNRIDGRPGL
ncbi:C40 family peptidase [Actinomadura rupiterrae]|uniref:C40 family peptidase n=1 Tax=Actinomadura rupiterrae TaxID=559627 RepID=UPI0035578EA8